MVDKVLIYEVHFSNINRYVVPLAKHLIENEISKEVVVVYDSFVESDKIDLGSLRNVSHHSVKKEFNKQKNVVNKNVVFLNYSYRITDLYWTYKFKKRGIYCCQIQHGMYAEFLERSFLGYFSALSRKLTYLKYLLSFLLKFDLAIFLYLFNKDFLKSFRINSHIEKRRKKIAPVQSDHVFVWGEYWKEWFIKNHYYLSNDLFTIMGNPDYHTFIKHTKYEMQRDKVCYIAQTFVEDGRMERNDYKNIIDKFAEALKDRLIIKLHPRSDKSIFEHVLKMNGEITYDFPISGFYIGHYSSVLALAINMDSKVFLLEINNEEIPDYFRNSANMVFSKQDDLVNAILGNDDSVGSKQISYYFENIDQHPFEIISNKIININD
ncbi:MAG: alpha-2,8-polysialyltransferase family protein [Maribacter sp.]|nr:alpha-2,8-polysialyltransferase family protein [Maribacter sp.]